METRSDSAETLEELFRPYVLLRIAEQMNVDSNTVYGWKSGARMPSSDKLPALARLLNTDIARLANAFAMAAEKRKREVGRAS